MAKIKSKDKLNKNYTIVSQLANSLNNDKLIVTFPYERTAHKISLDNYS